MRYLHFIDFMIFKPIPFNIDYAGNLNPDNPEKF
jgi:hypothetical protein